MTPRSILSLTLILASTQASPAAEPASFDEVRGLVTQYCGNCHGEKVQKGGVNLAAFDSEAKVLRQRKLWRGVAEQLSSGDMPPEGKPQPTAEQKQRLLAWIGGSLNAADARDRDKPDPGRSIVRRLTRAEYNRTIRDLMGVEIDAAGAVGMPDETVGGGFDTLASALNMSGGLMEKYFAAADLVVTAVYESARPEWEKPKPGEALRAYEQVIIARPGLTATPGLAAWRVVSKLARRAYRRPVEDREIDRLMTLFDPKVVEKGGYLAALRPVLKAILVSPNFLLRVERDRASDAATSYRVNDHELATRLSYFLWSSMPDAELFARAEANDLHEPAVLEKQVRRMLADPKARALADVFAAQWMHLRDLPDARPSTEFFPTFTPQMRLAMHAEAIAFFDNLRTVDRPVTDLLDADYTFVNEELARHYGIKGVTGPEMRRVALTDPNRGGLLGMGAVLAVTSHTSRTSPTLRGKYVLEVILGTPPPPPPPNVSQIDEAKAGKEATTFRQQLALHASQASCAGCHAKIDPLGFGLESFDAVGRLRPPSKDLDASGKLPTGETFTGPKELRKVLVGKKARFVENITERMLTYALGRPLQSSDDAVVRSITSDLQKSDFKFSTLVLGVVRSYPFQYRRNLLPDEPE